jgi:hypothetical protein
MTIQPKVVLDIALPAYCDHASILHDGQTWLCLTDAGNSVILWRWNWYKNPAEWDQLWDLARDYTQWPSGRKPGLGHDQALNINGNTLAIAVPYKILGTTPAIGGTTVFLFDRAKFPAMQP